MKRPHTSEQIHPLAHVADSDVDPTARVWQFASVIRGAFVGPDVTVGATAMIDAAYIGRGSIISAGAKINPGARLAANVFIGPNVVLCNDAFPRADKDGWTLDAVLDASPVVRIDDGASIGANATICPGVIIGAGAFVAAGEVVNVNVPPAHMFKNGAARPLGITKRTRIKPAC